MFLFLSFSTACLYFYFSLFTPKKKEEVFALICYRLGFIPGLKHRMAWFRRSLFHHLSPVSCWVDELPDLCIPPPHFDDVFVFPTFVFEFLLLGNLLA